MEQSAVRPSPPALSGGAVVLLLLLSGLWGANPVAVRFALESFPPLGLAAARFALAAAFMFFWCRLERVPLRIDPAAALLVLGGGALLFVQIATFHLGVARSNASHSSLFINTFIFWVLAIEHWVTRRDRLTSRKAVGVALAAVGTLVALLLARERVPAAGTEAPTLEGDLILLLSALLLGVKIVYTKAAVARVPPSTFVFWHDVVGCVLLGAVGAAWEGLPASAPSTPAFLGLLYQGILVAGVCFAVQAHLLRTYSASQISVFSFSTPLFGIGAAALLRGDVLSPWLVAAGLLVAAGIYLVQRGRR